jgi:hypothetical protein
VKYEEIIAGFRALQAVDFEYGNDDARGWERLGELTDALKTLRDPEKAIPEMFAVMERLPDADIGSPGALVHTLEKFRGYEKELVLSVARCPSTPSVWMVNRILNTDLSSADRRMYMTLLEDAAAHPKTTEAVRLDARSFIVYQNGKTV